MVETRKADHIVNEFLGVNVPPKDVQTGGPSGLTDRLRQKVEEAKKRAEEVCSDTIKYYIGVLNRHIVASVASPHESKWSIKGNDGNDYEVTLKFADGYCDLVSDIFPQPFWIIPDEKVDKIPRETADGVTIYSVSDFARIRTLSDKFGVTVKL